MDKVLEKNNHPYILDTAEPFFFLGGPVGCLLVHGYTGTPKEMRKLGEYLHELGYTVLGVRLAGHATSIDAMIRSRWQDWAASVEDGWRMLENMCDEVFVIGLSMGSVLALYHASRFPTAGVVALSTMDEVPDKLYQRFRPVIKLVSKVIPTREKKGTGSWFDPKAQADHVAYAANPVRPVVELDLLIQEMNANLHKLTAPVLAIHSIDDKYVPIEFGESLFNRLETPDKEWVVIHNCCHVIVSDENRDEVFNRVSKFIHDHQSQ